MGEEAFHSLTKVQLALLISLQIEADALRMLLFLNNFALKTRLRNHFTSYLFKKFPLSSAINLYSIDDVKR